MKAEHRKELKSNALLTALQTFWRSLWDGTRSTSFYVGILVVLLVVGIVAAWWIYSSIAASSRAKLWLAVEDINSLKDISQEQNNPTGKIEYVSAQIQSFTSKNKGTMPARVAQFQEARLQLHYGMEWLGAALFEDQPTVRKSLERAASLYASLAKETADFPALQQEALLGAAKAHEGLGNLKEATTFYQQLANAKPESGQTKQAKDFLAAFDDPEKKARIEEFYNLVKTKLNYATPAEKQ